MASFSDHIGRVWDVVISPYEYKKLKTKLDLDLYDIVDQQKAQATLGKLESDDCLLSDALWLICEDDATAKGVSQREFQREVRGEALNQGFMAILDAQTDFFKRPEQRDAARKLADFVREVNRQLEPVAQEVLGKIDVQQAVKKFIDSVTSSPERSASTRSRRTGTDGGGIRLAN